MSIVERAADKLRRTDAGTAHTDAATAQGPLGETEPNAPVRDHVAAAGQRIVTDSHKQAEPAELASRPSLAPLAIDFAKLRQAGLIAPVSDEEMVAREFKRIKRPVLTYARGVEVAGNTFMNCCMVASATPGEGKSFNAVNLALSLAKERDYDVILIDGDVIKPAISRALGVKDKPGLTSILADHSLSLGDIVRQTSIPKLSFLPAGPRHPDATELLASQRMNWLIGELSRDPKRVVIIDSPPLLATAESQALAMFVGQVLVVVKAGSTNQSAVLSALSLIAAPDKKVSLILNQSTKAHGDHYAGYYGSYYYDHETGV